MLSGAVKFDGWAGRADRAAARSRGSRPRSCRSWWRRSRRREGRSTTTGPGAVLRLVSGRPEATRHRDAPAPQAPAAPARARRGSAPPGAGGPRSRRRRSPPELLVARRVCRCGHRFYAERVLGLPHAPEPPGASRAIIGAAARRSAADRGVLLHALLERLDFRRPRPAAEDRRSPPRPARGPVAAARARGGRRAGSRPAPASPRSDLCARLGRAPRDAPRGAVCVPGDEGRLIAGRRCASTYRRESSRRPACSRLSDGPDRRLQVHRLWASAEPARDRQDSGRDPATDLRARRAATGARAGGDRRIASGAAPRPRPGRLQRSGTGRPRLELRGLRRGTPRRGTVAHAGASRAVEPVPGGRGRAVSWPVEMAGRESPAVLF